MEKWEEWGDEAKMPRSAAASWGKGTLGWKEMGENRNDCIYGVSYGNSENQ